MTGERSLTRRSCERRNPYAAAIIVGRDKSTTSAQNNCCRWIWVPAFAGTTLRACRIARSPPGDDGRALSHPSFLRTQEPIRRSHHCRKRQVNDQRAKQLLPVDMGPCVRRDDAESLQDRPVTAR